MTTLRDRDRVIDPNAALQSALNRIAELADELDSKRVREESAALSGRLAEGRFYVACIGQFKRGKSTLLCALVGDRVLPTGILPVTTVPTVVRYGPRRGARVRFHGGSWTDIAPEELTKYVSEELNPENGKGVAGVEVFLPCTLLATGMCLVDTPGLGSVFSGNTAATKEFVPHIDAALVVLDADPPIAGDELALVGDVGKHVRNLLIVMNKADKTSEEDRRIAKAFTRDVLEKRLKRPIGLIYEVSAEERLAGEGPERDWRELVDALERLVEGSGTTLVRAAGERGMRRFSEELLAVTAEEKQALNRPIEESERRIHSLRQTLSEAERSLHELGYLFMAEQHHLSDVFLGHRKEFLTDELPKARAEFSKSLAALHHGYGPKFRKDAMRVAIVVAERYVRPWLESEQEIAEAEYRSVAARFVNIGNDFLKKLSDSKVPELARTPNALNSDNGFRVQSAFMFEQLLHVAQPASPLRYMADVFLGAALACRAIEKDAKEFLEYLLEMNSTRVQSDIIRRVEESRGQLEAEIRKLLHEISRIAMQALDRARETKAAGAAFVEADIARLDGFERELKELRSRAAD